MRAPARLKDLCLDANDVPLVARFWAAVLGYRAEIRADGVAGLTGDGLTVWVNPVAERKTVKDRVHLDVSLDADDPAALVALGATVLRRPDGDIDWFVLADPEGHEFCAFPPR